MQKVRVARNPGPAGLLVINPKRGKKTMATRKRRRKSTARHSTARRTSNLTHRRRRTRRSNPTVHASSRRRHVTRRSRRHNPSPGGLVTQAAGLALGITAAGLAQGFVPPIGGVSPFAVAGRQAAVGYGLGWAMKKFGFLSKYAGEVQLAGVALGFGTLVNAYLLPTITGFFRPAPKPTDGNGVQGIGVFRPGMQPYGSYAPRGLNGIAPWAQGQQPFGDYAGVAVV